MMALPSTTRRTVNRWGEGVRLREEIMAAATRLLSRTTSRDAVTLRSIAREAGIAAPSIYKHFADRDEVLDAVVSATFEQLEHICAQAFVSADTGAGRIRSISHAYVAFATDHQPAYRILFDRFGATGTDRLDGADGHSFPAGIRAFGYFIDAFAQLADETRATSIDSVADAQALWAALHGIVTLVPATPGFPWTAPDDLVDRLIRGLTD